MAHCIFCEEHLPKGITLETNGVNKYDNFHPGLMPMRCGECGNTPSKFVVVPYELVK